MEFRKYQHIERFGTDEVRDIEFGECFIFYKIDGTNGSVWCDLGDIYAGSRNRTLTLDNDNAGFYQYILQDENIKKYFEKHPTHRLFGEWLVPHSLRTYRQSAWRKFYIFDVCLDKDDESLEYIPYNIYKEFLDEFDLEYIPPIATIKNANYDSLLRLLDKTGQFLIEDGAGLGEGLVVKNYNFYNKYGRQTWAKMVRTEFKEKLHKVMGAPNITSKTMVEEKIVFDYCTKAFIEKEFEKIKLEKGWSSKFIPILLSKVFHELIAEESWNIVKKMKMPTINYKTLNSMIIQKIKETLPEIFS